MASRSGSDSETDGDRSRSPAEGSPEAGRLQPEAEESSTAKSEDTLDQAKAGEMEESPRRSEKEPPSSRGGDGGVDSKGAPSKEAGSPDDGRQRTEKRSRQEQLDGSDMPNKKAKVSPEPRSKSSGREEDPRDRDSGECSPDPDDRRKGPSSENRHERRRPASRERVHSHHRHSRSRSGSRDRRSRRRAPRNSTSPGVRTAGRRRRSPAEEKKASPKPSSVNKASAGRGAELADGSSAPPPPAKVSSGLTTKTGGAYIPPAKLRMMQAKITDKSSVEFQRLAWEALKKSINGLINKVNSPNIGIIVRELFSENIVRGRGLLCQSIMQVR